MQRRSLLKVAGSLAGVTALGGVASAADQCPVCAKGKPAIAFKNADFYTDGKFDVEKAKDGVLALCKHHGYPIFPTMRDGLWVSDYGIGRFMDVGLAACLFMNNVPDRYMLMDLFLMPGQMLPEHWHVEGEGNPAKREGWLVRYGVSHIVGIGEPNLGPDVKVPECHWKGKVLTKHETVATPGMFVPLAQVETRHWQLAGPEGAIVTEVANVHTNSGVRHSDPVMNDYFLESLKKK
jgi:D-lyxose ketol-isomerase